MLSTRAASQKPAALSLLSSERPRNVGWLQAAGLLFGDWGTSRLYVLGLAFFFAQRTSFYLIAALSLLVIAVAWAFGHICRIYPDGGGVYTAAKSTSRTLAVVGALLLFADYTVTASLSVLDAFRYFGLSDQHFLAWNSAGLWAVVAIALIGFFNLFGPRHTGSVAIWAAVAMVALTLLVAIAAMSQVNWSTLPQRIGVPRESPGQLWSQFVSIILALSGVEAIANLTGVMKRPVSITARKAIWVVAGEVAILNLLLAIAMIAAVSLTDPARHRDDMMAFLGEAYVGNWAEIGVRIVGGVLLLSAGNTAITDMISIQYLMARDGELPRSLQGLNRYGVPWIPAFIAAAVPCLIVAIVPSVEQLAHFYAMGLVGALCISVVLCALHPRLRRWHRRVPMILLGLLLAAIWVTVGYTKREALLFVTIILLAGLVARQVTKWWATRRGPRISLLRQAIVEQLTPDVLGRPKVLVGTYGSEALAPAALSFAKAHGMTLVVCFIRQVSLSVKWDTGLTIDTDLAAQKTFLKYLEMGHDAGVPIMPVYDTGPDAVVLLAETAAVYGCERLLIGTSRQGAIHHLIKGSFHNRLESLLPPEIRVQVIGVKPHSAIVKA